MAHNTEIDISNELNEAYDLAEKLNDILANIHSQLDADSVLNLDSFNRLEELTAVVEGGNGLTYYLAALKEIAYIDNERTISD